MNDDKFERSTPQWLFDILDMEFNFDIDVCASKYNAKCKHYITKELNCLKGDWYNKDLDKLNCGFLTCWMNPPYGRKIKPFMKKAYEQSLKGNIIVSLVAGRFDTRWWWNWVLKAYKIQFIKGRLKFDNMPTGAKFPSCLVIYNHYQKCRMQITEPLIEWVDYKAMKNG